jgi:menaquinol-cytochrome c reductase cytochrome b/c subunit
MPRMTARERREAYQREHDFQVKTGKPFFPNAIFHDTIASLVTVVLIMGMTIIWRADFGPVPDDPEAGRAGGFLGPAYEGRADPGTEEYDPRPEWYFFFLFQLLRIFKEPEMLLFATIIIPTILMVLMMAWPFIDRRPERRVSRRPIAMVLAVATPVALMFLTWEGSKAPAVGAASDHPGAAAFANVQPCGTCHTLADAGTGGTLGPNLDTTNPDYATALTIISDGKGAMPAFKAQGLTDDELSCLAGYIATYGASQGGAPGPKAATAEGYPDSCTAAGADYAGAAAG